MKETKNIVNNKMVCLNILHPDYLNVKIIKIQETGSDYKSKF
jgi:hypothetical protein